jgi:hypothetical protein
MRIIRLNIHQAAYRFNFCMRFETARITLHPEGHMLNYPSDQFQGACMKMFTPTVIVLLGLASLVQAQPSSRASELSPEEFVDVVTGAKELPPGVVIFTLDRDPERQAVQPRPLIALPAYGATLPNTSFSGPDLALAGSAGMFFNKIFAEVLDFGSADASKLEATQLGIPIEDAIKLVDYSESLVYLYRKTFSDKIGTACSQLDSNLLGMGETNALQVFGEALDAGELFITQFYLDAIVDLDRYLDPIVVAHVVEQSNMPPSTQQMGSAHDSLGSMASAENWAWINGYCGARRRDQERLITENLP